MTILFAKSTPLFKHQWRNLNQTPDGFYKLSLHCSVVKFLRASRQGIPGYLRLGVAYNSLEYSVVGSAVSRHLVDADKLVVSYVVKVSLSCVAKTTYRQIVATAVVIALIKDVQVDIVCSCITGCNSTDDAVLSGKQIRTDKWVRVWGEKDVHSGCQHGNTGSSVCWLCQEIVLAVAYVVVELLDQLVSHCVGRKLF